MNKKYLVLLLYYQWESSVLLKMDLAKYTAFHYSTLVLASYSADRFISRYSIRSQQILLEHWDNLAVYQLNAKIKDIL